MQAGEASAAAEFVPTLPFELVSPAARAELPEDVEDAYPLAQAQAGMLFHSERQRASSMYHDLFTMRVEGRFDERVLRGVFDTLSLARQICPSPARASNIEVLASARKYLRKH